MESDGKIANHLGDNWESKLRTKLQYKMELLIRVGILTEFDNLPNCGTEFHIMGFKATLLPFTNSRASALPAEKNAIFCVFD